MYFLIWKGIIQAEMYFLIWKGIIHALLLELGSIFEEHLMDEPKSKKA
jgi:hypothetical protein